MLEKTRTLLEEKNWKALALHIGRLEPEAAPSEIEKIVKHIEKHYDEEDWHWVINAAVWHNIFRALARGSTRYEEENSVEHAATAIRRALAYRGPCVLELIPPVLHALRQSPAYHANRQVNRKIALKITSLARKLQHHPKAEAEIREKAAKLRAHVLSEIKSGYREYYP